jgi:four helix bundle protein
LRNYKELKVWEKSHLLVLKVYRVTMDFPKSETYGLTGQMRRACASIPMNIAEGCGRSGTLELAHFLNIAMGSASELSYQLLLARDLEYLKTHDHYNLDQDLSEVMRMLTVYIQKIKAELAKKKEQRKLR